MGQGLQRFGRAFCPIPYHYGVLAPHLRVVGSSHKKEAAQLHSLSGFSV